MIVVWSAEALTELEEITAYVLTSGRDVPLPPEEAIPTATEQLAAFPHLGGKGIAPGTRELLVHALPYVLVYEIIAGAVVILHVKHSAQNRG